MQKQFRAALEPRPASREAGPARPVATAVTERIGDGLIGCVLGDRYRIERVQSRGGMSVVYAAVYEQQQREVAVKVLDPAIAAEPQAVERFLHEAATASSLSHGHVVGVSDFGCLPDGRPYLVMPLIAGTDLATLLTDEGPMSPRRAAALLAGVASALDAMHAEGLLHRDIKSENLMHVGDDDEHETALLLDFGIAASSPVPARAESEEILGTPEFMAPEALAGESFDHQSDVYSLATVAFELITGRLPFEGADLDALLRNKTAGSHCTLSEATGYAFPPSLERVFARGLAREAVQRQASAGAFVHELGAAAVDLADDPLRPPVRASRPTRAATLVGTGASVAALRAAAAKRALRNTRTGWSAQAHEPDHAAATPPDAEPAPRLEPSSPFAARLERADDTFRPPPALDAAFDEDARALRGSRGVAAYGRLLGYAAVAALPVAAWLSLGGPPAPPLAAAPPPAVPAVAAPAPSMESVPAPAAPAVAAPLASAKDASPPVTALAPAAIAPSAGSTDLTPPAPARAKLTARARTPSAKPVRPASASTRARTNAAATVAASASAPELTQQATDALFSGDFAAARAGFRKALRADAQHAPAWRGLGLLLDRTGEDADAVRALRRYLALRPDAPDADKVRGRIEALEAPR